MIRIRCSNRRELVMPSAYPYSHTFSIIDDDSTGDDLGKVRDAGKIAEHGGDQGQAVSA